MEDKQLISKLQELKQIKPRNEWVVLAKSNVFWQGRKASDKATKEVFQNGLLANQNGLLANMLSLLSGRKLAYSMAVLLFVLMGLVAMPSILFNGNLDQGSSGVDLVSVKNDIQTLKTVSETLKEVTNQNVDSLAVQKFTSTAKNLTDSVKKSPKIARDVAVELKTLASLSSTDGEEVRKASEELYKEVDKQIIEELKRATLTDEQKLILAEAIELFEKGDYFGTLEKILLINISSPEEISTPSGTDDAQVVDEVNVSDESIVPEVEGSDVPQENSVPVK